MNPTLSPAVEPSDDTKATRTGLKSLPPIPVAINPGAGKKRDELEIKLNKAIPVNPKDFKSEKFHLNKKGIKSRRAEATKSRM